MLLLSKLLLARQSRQLKEEDIIEAGGGDPFINGRVKAQKFCVDKTFTSSVSNNLC